MFLRIFVEVYGKYIYRIRTEGVYPRIPPVNKKHEGCFGAGRY